MSETVHYKGKLEHIEKNERTLEELCKDLCNDYLKITTSNYIEEINYNDEFVIVDNEVYLVLYKEPINEEDDIFNAKMDNSEDIEFEVRYYNGGCGFDEAIETAIKKMKEDK